MSQPPCGPYTEGYLTGTVQGPLVPDNESLIHYKEEGSIGDRPKREAVREEIADYVLAMLGAPMVRIELDRQQLSIAVDEALKRYENGCGKSNYAYSHFTTIPGINRYELKGDIGIINNVFFSGGMNCYGADIAVATSVEATDIIDFAGANIPGMGYGGYGSYNTSTPFQASLGEWHLMQSYSKMFSRVSSMETTWEIASGNSIMLYPSPRSARNVGVHYLQRKKDWPEAASWMKDYALALAKEMLGRVRSKYDRYVSPGGGVTLDGASLLAEAREDKTSLSDSLISNHAVTFMLPYVG